jgi:hypothetical protein
MSSMGPENFGDGVEGSGNTRKKSEIVSNMSSRLIENENEKEVGSTNTQTPRYKHKEGIGVRKRKEH